MPAFRYSVALTAAAFALTVITWLLVQESRTRTQKGEHGPKRVKLPSTSPTSPSPPGEDPAAQRYTEPTWQATPPGRLRQIPRRGRRPRPAELPRPAPAEAGDHRHQRQRHPAAPGGSVPGA